jgi:ketosteroid isomerase-like protein
MPRVILLAATLTTLAACSRSSTTAEATSGPAPAGAEQDLLRIEQEWGDALGRHDSTFFNRVLADDYLATVGAKTETKREYMAENLSGPPTPADRYELGDTHVRQYGPVAIVTGLVTYPAQDRRERYTEVWTKEGGQWRVHVGHYNTVPGGHT